MISIFERYFTMQPFTYIAIAIAAVTQLVSGFPADNNIITGEPVGTAQADPSSLFVTPISTAEYDDLRKMAQYAQLGYCGKWTCWNMLIILTLVCMILNSQL